MSQQPEEKKGKGTQWVQLAVVVVALAIVAYFVIRILMSFIWWIVAFLGVGLLIINRKLVVKIFNYIKNLYTKNTVLGVAGTLGAIVAFLPFMGFLFLKTIWDFRKSDMVKKKGGKQEEEPVSMSGKTPIVMDEPSYEDLDETSYKDLDSMNPPTQQ